MIDENLLPILWPSGLCFSFSTPSTTFWMKWAAIRKTRPYLPTSVSNLTNALVAQWEQILATRSVKLGENPQPEGVLWQLMNDRDFGNLQIPHVHMYMTFVKSLSTA